MFRSSTKAHLIVALLTLILGAAHLRAAIVFDFTLDTSALIGHASGPFSLDFQLTDGDLAANSVTISNFNFGGGAPQGAATTVGGVTPSSSLASSVQINDTSFLNEFFQAFTPGATLSFRVSLTTSFGGGTPDQFSIALLDNTPAEVPTLDPVTGIVLLRVDINSANPLVERFAIDPAAIAGIDAPAVTIIPTGGPGPAVPLPTAVLTALAILPLFPRRSLVR